MTNGLSNTQVKILTFLVYALIFVLSFITGWHQIKIDSFGDDYVRLEQYRNDCGVRERKLDRIENKLDQLIMRQVKK